jgi:hypothetical protein
MPNLLQAGKSKYDGPKNHRAIIRQIHKDCKQAMSCDFIDRVVGLFFSHIGIQKYMLKGVNFKIPLLGSFSLSKRGQRKRAKFEAKRNERARLSHNKKMSKYMKKRRAQIALKKVNKNRAEIGMEPLKFNTFIKITGRKL